MMHMRIGWIGVLFVGDDLAVKDVIGIADWMDGMIDWLTDWLTDVDRLADWFVHWMDRMTMMTS